VVIIASCGLSAIAGFSSHENAMLYTVYAASRRGRSRETELPYFDSSPHCSSNFLPRGCHSPLGGGGGCHTPLLYIMFMIFKSTTKMSSTLHSPVWGAYPSLYSPSGLWRRPAIVDNSTLSMCTSKPGHVNSYSFTHDEQRRTVASIFLVWWLGSSLQSGDQETTENASSRRRTVVLE